MLLRIFLCVGVALASAGCSIGYVIKQGYYQAKLICGSESIEKALKKRDLSSEQRVKLQEILDMRTFSSAYLALTPGKNYTKVNLSWHEKIYNVSASRSLAFEPFTWWFPIVGTVPYKGFFDRKDALSEVKRLKDLNYDVMMYVVGGYSTLGYFNDPIWPQMLEKSESSLAELIIHELAHATVYFASQTDFNESFANFVGRQGALAYLGNKYGPASSEYILAKNMQDDEDRYMDFMSQLFKKLDAVYTSSMSDIDKLANKKEIIASSHNDYKKVPFATESYRNYYPAEINNALLMSFKRYNSDQPAFLKLFKYSDRSWPKFIDEMKALKASPDALLALQNRVKELASGPK